MEGNEHAVIAVATFGNQAVNVRIPFEIPAKSMKNHDITGSEVFGFVHFKEHVGNNTATEWKNNEAEFCPEGKNHGDFHQL